MASVDCASLAGAGFSAGFVAAADAAKGESSRAAVKAMVNGAKALRVLWF
jgi:hypothetical protein